MWKKKAKKKSITAKQHITLEIEGQQIPAIIYWEKRPNARISIGKKAVLIRFPLGMSPDQEKQQLAYFKEWLAKQIRKGRGVISHYHFRKYEDGDIIEVGKRQYQIRIEETENKRNNARLENGIIFLRLTKRIQGEERWKDVKSLLGRVVGNDFLPEIKELVHLLNQRHFQKNINSIRLKNNYSNSGSCSSRDNINLNIHLLFAPDKVRDYVIIHELAHLTEMNHSPRFWKLVEQAMPDYKECEAWLRENSRKIGF